jgi:threonine/homoserine/homoserine lactone efflux protein
MLLVFFLKGIAVGAIIAVPVGPVGVLCLRRTIFEGQLAGLVSGLGAASADAFFGIIAAFGLTFISHWLLGYESVLRAAGGCYLLYAGAHALTRPTPAVEDRQSRPQSLFRGFASTFVLTVTNPITILVFLGIFEALGLSGARATLLLASMLVAGVWSGSFVWWLLLSLGIGVFRSSIGARHLDWISRGSGAILFLSGAALIATVAVKQLARLL